MGLLNYGGGSSGTISGLVTANNGVKRTGSGTSGSPYNFSIDDTYANIWSVGQTFEDGLTVGVASNSTLVPVNFEGPFNNVTGNITWNDAAAVFGGSSINTFYFNSSAGNASIFSGAPSAIGQDIIDLLSGSGTSIVGASGSEGLIFVESTGGSPGIIGVGSNNGSNPTSGTSLYETVVYSILDGGFGIVIQATGYADEDWGGSNQGMTFSYGVYLDGGAGQAYLLNLQGDAGVVVNPSGVPTGYFQVTGQSNSPIFFVGANDTMAFFGGTPVGQYASAGGEVGYVANTSAHVMYAESTVTGTGFSTHTSLNDVVTCLKSLSLMT